MQLDQIAAVGEKIEFDPRFGAPIGRLEPNRQPSGCPANLATALIYMSPPGHPSSPEE